MQTQIIQQLKKAEIQEGGKAQNEREREKKKSLVKKFIDAGETKQHQICQQQTIRPEVQHAQHTGP